MLEVGLKENSSEQLLNLTVLLERFAALLNEENIPVRAHSPSSLAALGTFDVRKLEEIYNSFLLVYTVCEGAKGDGIRLRVTSEFVGYALEKMRLKAPQSFFEQLAFDDLVEIYDLKGIQIFRNMRFFDITAYSLADLLAYPWYELLERSSLVMQEMNHNVEKILKSNFDILPMAVPSHILKEIKVEPNNILQVKFKSISPIFNEKKEKTGVIVSSNVIGLNREIQSKGLSFI